MAEAAKSDGRTKPPIGEALSRIEAALQAGLGGGAARPDLARQALGGGQAEADLHIEAWLEAVAAELKSSSAVLVPEELVEAIAERMMAEPKKTLGAHAGIAGENIQNLVDRA